MNNRAKLYFLFSFVLWILFTVPVQADRPRLIELKTEKGSYQGRVESKNKQYCWLMDRDGKLNVVMLHEVKKFRTVSSTFYPYPTPELKSRLAREFGKEFKIVSKGQYIVCASSEHARDYAELLDDTYRSFRNYFSRKGFHLPKPEFPLVAIIFPEFNSYAAYQRTEGLSPSRGILGYYMRSSNRVALYEEKSPGYSLNENRKSSSRQVARNVPLEKWLVKNLDAGKKLTLPIQSRSSRPESQIRKDIFHPVGKINENLKSLEGTIIHEATHQIAFNTGLHSRTGETPKWIVEGLATVFEVPGIRDTKTTVKAMQRVNRDRYIWFQDYVSKRRKENSLLDFISSDRKFLSGSSAVMLDGYAEAWALTFFLLETQPVKYARYLRTIAEKEEDSSYPEKERISDFQAVFGTGTAKMEKDFLRFIDRL